MKKLLIFCLVFTGCAGKMKRYEIHYSSGKSTNRTYTDSYTIDEKGCLHLEDSDDNCGCKSPDIICGDFSIIDHGVQNF